MVGHFDPGQGGRLLSSRDRYGDENGAGGLNTFTTTSYQLLSGRSVKAQNGNKWENLHAGVFPVKCQQSLKKKTPEGWNSPLGSRYFSTWSSDEWPPRQTGELHSSRFDQTNPDASPTLCSWKLKRFHDRVNLSQPHEQNPAKPPGEPLGEVPQVRSPWTALWPRVRP